MSQCKQCVPLELNQQQQMIINQQYKIWKKQAPYYYDLMILHSVDWPTFTFQWLPEVEVQDDFTSHFAIIGSSNTDVDMCQLQKIKVDLPNQHKTQKYAQNKQHKIKIIQKIQHNGQINRARYCHADSRITAIATNKGDITLTTMKEPICKLIGHTAEGYGLNWNPINKQLLVSGFTDKRICIWDIEKNKQQNQKIFPAFEILHHNAPIEDVAWHRFHPNIFGSCSDDRLVMIWDMRFRSSTGHEDKKPLFQIVAHTDEVYSIDFSPFNEFLFASGSGDQNVAVWDMRNLTRSLTTFNGQKNSVIKVQWSPFTSCILASCGYGRNVDIWDLSKQTKQQQANYLYRHMGHRSKVLDFDWNSNQKLVVGSVEEGNCIHVWQLARHIYYQEEEAK